MTTEIQADLFGSDLVPLPTCEISEEKPVTKKKALPSVKKETDYTIGIEPSALMPVKIPYETLFKHEFTATNGLLTGLDNSVKVQKNLFLIRKILSEMIGPELMEKFQLTQIDNKEIVHVIPVSGGADSSGVALLMRALFPNVPFVFVFTDTMAESPDLYYQLERLEEYLGIKINRVLPEHGLYQLIEKYNGFAPSQKSRYCTPILKIKTLLNWMDEHFDTSTQALINYVGIRFDEDRMGMDSGDDDITTEMPYFNLKMGKPEVFRLLMETVGIPDFYTYKTRSGCIGCFFMRRSEKSAQLLFKPDEFHFVSAQEKITANDRAKYGLHWNDDYRKAIFNPSYNIEYSNTQLLYYVPKSVDHRKAGELTDNIELHDNALEFELVQDNDREQIYVGVAMFTPKYAFMSDDHMVYKTQFVVYSNRRHNLIDQLHTWFEHQATNYAMFGYDSREEMECHINLLCFEVDLPKNLGAAIKSKTDEQSFTNSKGECYAQIEVITRLMHSVLTFERTKQDWLNTYEDFYPKGDFDPFLLGRMQSDAYYLKKDLDKQQQTMNLLGNPKIQTVEKVDILTEDELLLRSLKRKKKKSDNKEAINACVVCSL